MKLSNLVGYLNLLQSQEMSPDHVMSVRRLNEIAHVINNHAVQIENLGSDFGLALTEIGKQFNVAEQALAKLIEQVKQQISSMESELYQSSQHTYEQEMCFETTEYILNRQLIMDDQSRLALRARLMHYTDWRLPGLIIRPGVEKFIEDLVPLDPLYLVDQNQDLLKPAMEQFTPAYQRRLRLYEINDYEHLDPLWQLPSNQFGLIFAYNFLNYKPIKIVKNYLISMYKTLRPGGVAIFTINDCDWAHNVILAEKNFMCYTPLREIRQYFLEIGFDVLSVNRVLGDITWVEIQKPGDIESIRGGQTLAKIIAL